MPAILEIQLQTIGAIDPVCQPMSIAQMKHVGILVKSGRNLPTVFVTVVICGESGSERHS